MLLIAKKHNSEPATMILVFSLYPFSERIRNGIKSITEASIFFRKRRHKRRENSSNTLFVGVLKNDFVSLNNRYKKIVNNTKKPPNTASFTGMIENIANVGFKAK